MQKIKIAIFLLFLSLSQVSKAYKDDYVSSVLVYDDKVYTPNIKTVLFYFNGWETGFPAIRLNSDEQLSFGFDDFDNDYKTYNYTVVHCDASWQPTDISFSEYVEGFNQGQIDDINRSFNTYQAYTHYQMLLPNRDMRITKSGNYLLKIFLDGDEDKLAITRRFMVYEELVDAALNIHAATLNESRFMKQEVDFKISAGYYKIQDPMNDLKVVLMQNDRFDTQVEGLKPVFIMDTELDYNYDGENTFNGGKEFRYFNTQSLVNPDIRINKIRIDSSHFTHIYLNNDDKRAFKRYAYEKDINGKFIIRTTYGDNPNTDADYCYVHFYLMSSTPIMEGDVYIFGALSDWKCKPEFRMQYDPVFKGYTATLFLKQGFYNYEYVVMGAKDKVPDETLTEGNRFETENDFSIMVYHQPIGVFYDKLILYKKVKSNARKD
ncbi:MAG: DUF5103 domain-containing protein [Bacteroidia bacterium]|nr:DUF5103 domain-containing protein [Bacteroidia bacterium]